MHRLVTGLAISTYILVAAFLFSLTSNCVAENWTHFHGNDIGGVSKDSTLPDLASAESIAWRFPLSSRNVGSPAIFGDQVFLLDSPEDGAAMIVRCLDLKSGKEKWAKEYPHSAHHLHRRNTYASSTPAVDETRVVVCWSEPQHTIMKCLDHDGDELWQRDFGTWQSQHGFGTSPRIVKDKIYLLNSQQGEQLKPGEVPGKSRMISLDAGTGENHLGNPADDQT